MTLPPRPRGPFSSAPGLLVLCVLLVPFTSGIVALHAQEPAMVAVTVRAADTGEPLEGATLNVPALGRGTLTGAAGRAMIGGLPPGALVLEVSRIGYRPARLEVEAAAGRLLEVQVSMEVEPVPLGGVQATAPTERRSRQLELNGFYDRKRSGGGQFRDREHFDRFADRTSQLTHALMDIPGIYLRPNGGMGAGRYIVQSSRGGGRCAAQIFLDGRRLHNFGAGGRPIPPDIDDFLSPHQVEAIEWYQGAAQLPVRFRETSGGPTNASCGVLVIWSRQGR
jgi:hypothetical protein